MVLKKIIIRLGRPYLIASTIIGIVSSALIIYNYHIKTNMLASQIATLSSQKTSLVNNLSKIKLELENIKKEDQYVKNKKLEADIKAIETSYLAAVDAYEKLIDLKNLTKKTEKYDEAFAQVLTLLAEKNYASAEAKIKVLKSDIKSQTDKITASFIIPANLPSSNNPPVSGYQRQAVQTDSGSFMVDIISADLNSTRVIVDTATDGDCQNDCPVLPLSDYVARNGAYAGINGTYFCPADYPSCSNKKNTFEFLVMNKNKKYINSDRNVYSTIPAVIFLGNSVRYVGQSLEWGRDTSVDAVIANYPLLTLNGNIVYGGSGEPKLNSRGTRSFVGSSGSSVYIGVVWNASVAEAAKALHALGIQNSLNLDDGGSTALWFGGYKAGPGRNLPNALLFVKK